VLFYGLSYRRDNRHFSSNSWDASATPCINHTLHQPGDHTSIDGNSLIVPNRPNYKSYASSSLTMQISSNLSRQRRKKPTSLRMQQTRLPIEQLEQDAGNRLFASKSKHDQWQWEEWLFNPSRKQDTGGCLRRQRREYHPSNKKYSGQTLNTSGQTLQTRTS
jgi:hypothetical protein